MLKIAKLACLVLKLVMLIYFVFLSIGYLHFIFNGMVLDFALIFKPISNLNNKIQITFQECIPVINSSGKSSDKNRNKIVQSETREHTRKYKISLVKFFLD